MLDEQEWARFEPLLGSAIDEIQAYRRDQATSLQSALEHPHGADALALFERLTGEKAGSVEPLWHHRASLYGPPCGACGKPLRTPRANLCAACGAIA
jgi:hypothetical protein